MFSPSNHGQLRIRFLLAAVFTIAILTEALSVAAYDDYKKKVAKTGAEEPDNPVLTRLRVETIFGLTDQSGENVGRDDFRGPFTLMNFRCKWCSELCPKSMMRVTSVMKTPADPAKSAKPVFDTFDPARDTKTCKANMYYISTNARTPGRARPTSPYGCGMHLAFLSFRPRDSLAEHISLRTRPGNIFFFWTTSISGASVTTSHRRNLFPSGDIAPVAHLT